MTDKQQLKEALKAIRKNCVECSGGSFEETKNCNITDCPLYPYRSGRVGTP